MHISIVHYRHMETKLANRMKVLGLTDFTLAQQVGCDRSVITKVRNGKHTPSFKTILKLCAVTSLMPQDFVVKGESQ